MSNANYAVSFLNTPNYTIYSNPMGIQMKGVEYSGSTTIEELSKKLNQIALKALTTTAGGVNPNAGYGLVPIYVDPRVVDTTRKYTPLVELVPRVTNQGITADYNQITVKGGGFTAVEDAPLTESDDTYVRQSTLIKYLYCKGRVTGQAVAAMPGWILSGLSPNGGATGGFSDANSTNAKQLEVLVKTRSMRELEESLIISGDATTDATQFSGIIKLMGTTNTVDKDTGALALGDIDLAIQYAYDDGGRPNLAVCSSGVFTDLLGLLTAKIGYLQPTQQVFWGFSTIVLNTAVGQVPVIQSMYMSNDTGAKAMYLLDMSVVEMRVLQDLTYQDLAKTNDSEPFMLKIYECLIIKNTKFCASITEIS